MYDGRLATTIVIGDVHGCLEELDELLAILGVRHSGAGLVFLGDLIDRGPDSAGVVRRVRELGAACVLGNHEEKHLRWARHQARRASDGAANPMRAPSPGWLETHATLDDDALAYLGGLPITLPVGDGWYAVHAGAAPNRPFRKQKAAVQLRVRWIDDTGGMLGVADRPPRARRWAEGWRGPERIVYGHAVHDLADPVRDEHALGLDTGCCFGGRLTAWIAGTDEIVQVPARRAYAELRAQHEDG